MKTIAATAATVLVAFAGFATAAPVRAQDAGNLAKAQQLLDIMHMDATYTRMTQLLEQSVRNSEDQLFPPNQLTPALKQEQAAFQAKIFALVSASISWTTLRPDIAKIYANVYTGAQLDGLIAFYSSPLGQQVIEKTPDVLKASQALSQQRVAAMLPQLQQMMHDEQAKIQSMTGAPPAAGANK